MHISPVKLFIYSEKAYFLCEDTVAGWLLELLAKFQIETGSLTNF